MNDTLEQLYQTILQRRESADAEGSYVAKLASKGRGKIAQKIGEEATETVVEAVADKRDGVVSESADLLFHLMMLWADMGITPEDITRELARREGVSGLDEKASRTQN